MGNPENRTGNLPVHLKESPTSILIKSKREESKIPEIKDTIGSANHGA